MLKELIRTANGEIKADLVLKNAFYVDVFNTVVGKGDIALCGGKIAGIGNYSGKEEIDLNGKYVIPGLIDGHMHIESTQLTLPELAKAIVAHGTTTIVADSHEIVNVLGIKGMEYLMDSAKDLPLDTVFMLPSCVPATPFENSGAVIDAEQTYTYINDSRVWGLGEFMNYPGVLNCDTEVLKKLLSAKKAGKIIDGHAPDLEGNALNAYAAAGMKTDHECAGVKDLKEKVARGMYVHLREGSATRNIRDLAPAITEGNLSRLIICTDDRHASDLLKQGHLDNNLRLLVECGVNPLWAIKIATINTALCYGLKDKGAIAPSYNADLVVVEDLKEFNALYVFKDGKLVAKDKKPLFSAKPVVPEYVIGTVNVKNLKEEDFRLKLKGDSAKVIKLIHNNVLTKKMVRKVKKSYDGVVEVKGTNLLKLAVIERHKGTGNVGLGLIEDYGLKNGALALSVSHDSHNIIALGDDDRDMYLAVKELERLGGGMSIVSGGKVIDSLALEIAGLMSALDIAAFENKLEKMLSIAYEMGVSRDIQPFMSLSFLALVVIPELKITDRGLFDVKNFCFTSLEG